MPGLSKTLDPLISNRFYLDLGSDVGIAAIQEVSGLDLVTDVAETITTLKDGKVLPIKTPGAIPLKPGKLTLKYVTFKDDPAAKWRASVIAGKMAEARKNISLILYDLVGAETMRFNFADAWPSKRAFSNFSTKSNEPVTVTLTIEHCGVKVTGYNS